MAAPIRSADVAEAMDAALAAERAAEDAVREAQRAGAIAVQAATEQAAQIAHRCDERVRRVHDRCAAALAQRVAELVQESAATSRLTQRSHETPSESLLDRVAAWLTMPA
jgi:flagellar biosynthesis/type III secretory pathway protein FliH